MAGTCTVTLEKVDHSGTDPQGIRLLTFSWVGDASAGTVPATSITANQAKALAGLKAVLAITNPGSTAPTDNYDITITDEDGVDIFGGSLANRDTANSEQARPAIATLGGERLVDGSILTFNLTNNSVASATGVCKVYFIK